MPPVAPNVPESTDLLCEACGYMLKGLPETGRCPECGKPISESIEANRKLTAWETALKHKTSKASDTKTPFSGGPEGRASSPPRISTAFFQTTLRVILHPTHFYHRLAVRGQVASARLFAQWHWRIAAILFGLAGATHCVWYWELNRAGRSPQHLQSYVIAFALLWVALAILTCITLDLITRLAAKLTHWEATYRGMRLPYNVILRGLYYHAAHYVPVAAAATFTVLGYQIILSLNLLNLASPITYTGYLYLLCGQVIVSAVYLFDTYWIAMRNMMYANH